MKDELLIPIEDEPEKELDTSTNWEEWYIDHRIDLMREEQAWEI